MSWSFKKKKIIRLFRYIGVTGLNCKWNSLVLILKFRENMDALDNYGKYKETKEGMQKWKKCNMCFLLVPLKKPEANTHTERRRRQRSLVVLLGSREKYQSSGAIKTLRFIRHLRLIFLTHRFHVVYSRTVSAINVALPTPLVSIPFSLYLSFSKP